MNTPTKKRKPITYQQFMSAREIAEKQLPLFSYSSVTAALPLKDGQIADAQLKSLMKDRHDQVPAELPYHLKKNITGGLQHGS